jgi:hypothetical protein
MRKTLVYLAILAVLGFSIYYFLFNKNESPFNAADTSFTIKDTASIGKIFLADNSGDAVTLERTDSGWMVNRQYRVLKSTLELLLNTLARQQALYPVPQSAYNNTIKDLSTEAIKTEIYNRDGKNMAIFYVGGTALNNAGTNMLMEGAKTPYVVHIPGFVGYLTPRFSPQLKDWRDRTIFDVPANEIKHVSVQYVDNPTNSFEISKDERDSVVFTADKGITSSHNLNRRRADLYLTAFSNVHCEGYLNGLPDMDTTLKTAAKHSTIEVMGKHGQHQHVDIYWMAINKRSKNLSTHNQDIPDDYDADRLYAVINNYKDTVMIQQFVFRKIFHKAYEFYQEDEQTQKPNGPTKTSR